jgi:hypothetical protein
MELTLGEPFRLVYQSGNEHNPGDAIGLVVLTIEGDGGVRIDNRARGGLIEAHFQGTTDRSVIERILGHLREGGYPEVPRHAIPAGSALRTISIQSGTEESHCFPTAWHGVDALPGYREAYQLLDSIVTEVSRGKLELTGNPLTGVARPSE